MPATTPETSPFQGFGRPRFELRQQISELEKKLQWIDDCLARAEMTRGCAFKMLRDAAAGRISRLEEARRAALKELEEVRKELAAR